MRVPSIILRLLLLFVVLALAGGARADATSPSLLGDWKIMAGQKVFALVTITRQGDTFEGTISKLYGLAADSVCDRCAGDLKGKPFLGWKILQNLVPDGASYKNGRFSEPNTGDDYNARLELSADGKTLKLHLTRIIDKDGKYTASSVTSEWQRLDPNLTAAGVWMQRDGSQFYVFRFKAKEDLFEGEVTRAIADAGHSPDRSMIGSKINHLLRKGLDYENGEFISGDGQYSGDIRFELAPDGETMTVELTNAGRIVNGKREIDSSMKPPKLQMQRID